MDNIKNDFYFCKRIIKSIEILNRYVEGKTLDDFLSDCLLLDAIENRFTKIAEDASKLTKEYRCSIPEIPWNAISTIRNKVCHDYDVVDASSLFKTIKCDFADFKNNLLKNTKFHSMNLYKDSFEATRAKKKTIEMRLLDEKRQSVKIGDLIVFKCKDTNEEVIAEVVDLKAFESFQDLYSHYSKTQIGYSINDVANPEDMKLYYSEDDLNRYKALAIEIRLY